MAVNKGLIKEFDLGSCILLLGFLDYELHVTIIIPKQEFINCVNKIWNVNSLHTRQRVTRHLVHACTKTGDKISSRHLDNNVTADTCGVYSTDDGIS